jgi:Putative beta-barrel porin-2, OmpL-like. bbp2
MKCLRHSALCGTVIFLLFFGGSHGLQAQEAGKAERSGAANSKDVKSDDVRPVTDTAAAVMTDEASNIPKVAPLGANAPASPVMTADASLPASANNADDDAADPQAPAASPGTVPPLASRPGFFTRWGQAYVADWHGNPPGTDPKFVSPRRGTPPPISSPPFPATDWPIGGTPLIGAPDTQTYPFMQAVNENKSRSKWYGWVSVGANGSTNNKGHVPLVPANFPSAYDEYPNTIVLDQFAVYYERIPNEAQTDHFDWGWRLTSLYGQDYRFTTSKGMLSQQLLVKDAQYGWDPVMFYLDFYLPHIGQGTNVRFGRYISLPDIEAQLAPNNYSYSHSILYTVDCYTQLGMNWTTKINDHWTVQAGISPGCDVMPWTTDAKVTGNVCVQFTWRNGGDVLYTCDNTINNGKYAYNNLTAFYETWYHRFNDHWHTDTEAWYQYMRDTPNVYWYNGTDPATGIQYANTPQTPWPEAQNYRPGSGASTLNFGAVCVDPRLPAAQQPARCYAPEWAITNYVEHNFWKNQASLNIRNEFVNDIKGQRIGTPGKYEEHMVGLNFWVGSTVTFRPEVSFTKYYGSWGLKALDIAPGSAVANLQNGNPQTGKTYAATLAADLIWHF